MKEWNLEIISVLARNPWRHETHRKTEKGKKRSLNWGKSFAAPCVASHVFLAVE
jgi:hypothetical protein